jgi:hypothetical protein
MRTPRRIRSANTDEVISNEAKARAEALGMQLETCCDPAVLTLAKGRAVVKFAGSR